MDALESILQEQCSHYLSLHGCCNVFSWKYIPLAVSDILIVYPKLCNIEDRHYRLFIYQFKCILSLLMHHAKKNNLLLIWEHIYFDSLLPLHLWVAFLLKRSRISLKKISVKYSFQKCLIKKSF